MVNASVLSAELDFVAEFDVEREARTYALRFGVTHEVIETAGPGGGHPVVKFTGDPVNLDALLRDYNGE